MKKIFLAALAVCAIFTGCSKETNNVPTEGDNVLIVRLPNNVTTRAVEAQVAGGAVATAITNAEVFLINAGSGAVVDRKTFVESEAGSKYMRIEQVASTVTKVVVVANIPSSELSAVQALTTYNAVKNFAFTVAGQNAGIGGINDKTLMGEGTPATATDPDTGHEAGHDYKEVTVALNSLTARFEIGAVKAGTGIESVELVGVWINNFYADGSKGTVTFNNYESTFWDTTPATTTSPSDTEFSGTISVATYDPTQYYNAHDAEVLLHADSKVYAYHVFAGTNIPHVIMLVKGVYAETYYAEEEETKYFLGWVTFRNFLDPDNDNQPISSIDANMIYKIGVGATGIVIDAKNITEDPELDAFDLGIKCTITPWTEKTVTPSVE